MEYRPCLFSDSTKPGQAHTPNGKRLTISGISVVNGAQTTATLGVLPNAPSDEAIVPARFVRCSDPELVQEIVRYNNSQNRIEPADFRSTDTVQRQLRREFQHYGSKVTYRGGRRGWPDSIIRRPQNDIPSDTAAQALAAFHQDPVLAYHRKSRIWEDDEKYAKVFNQGTHADHIVFVYSLHQAINEMKVSLAQKPTSALTQSEAQVMRILRMRGSAFLLMSAVGSCMEGILQSSLPSLFLLRFRGRPDLAAAEALWVPIIQACMPFSKYLEPPLRKNLVSDTDVRTSVEGFRSLVEATRLGGNRAIHDTFASRVTTELWPLV